MLQAKKSNVDRVTKLISIVSIIANYNLNKKTIGKRSNGTCQKNNLIAPAQYGSRKGKQAVEHALKKQLSYDLIAQTTKNPSMTEYYTQ